MKAKKEGQAVGLDLAYVHYYDTPGANQWRHERGLTATRPTAEIQLEEKGFKGRCRVVEPCMFTLQGQQLPWVGVVPVVDILKLVPFGPVYKGMGSKVSQWCVYDILEPVQESMDLASQVQACFADQLRI